MTVHNPAGTERPKTADKDGQRVALVTGGGAGIGRAIAEVLVDGHIACAVLDRRPGPLEETAAAAASRGVQDLMLPIAGDVTASEDRRRAVDTCLARFGRLDILVNNAGIARQAPLLTQSEEEWREVMAVNLDACFFMAQQALPVMRRQGWGRIVNITSVYATLALNAALYPGMYPDDAAKGPLRQPSYHSSKGGLLNMTRDLAAAVARWGITVNSVTPGMLVTEQSLATLTDEAVTRLTEMTPIGRMGEPREIGYAVRFLASDEAAFITGVELRVDGGWSIW